MKKNDELETRKNLNWGVPKIIVKCGKRFVQTFFSLLFFRGRFLGHAKKKKLTPKWAQNYNMNEEVTAEHRQTSDTKKREDRRDNFIFRWKIHLKIIRPHTEQLNKIVHFLNYIIIMSTQCNKNIQNEGSQNGHKLSHWKLLKSDITKCTPFQKKKNAKTNATE